MTSSSDTEAQVVEAYRAMCSGMLKRDTDLLDALPDDGYTLTHMTGYRQARKEWLHQIDLGEMQYHRVQQDSTSVEVAGDTAVLIGRDVVDATIWGSRGTWSLELTTSYERRADAWIAVRTVAAMF
jgi:ketosteroid isomerase-like protein